MPNTILSQILFFLWIIWAVFLFGGGFIGKPDAEHTRRMPRWTRMVSSAVLMIAAWGYALLYREQVYADAAVLIAVGMTLCFIGDLFMAQLILRDDRHVLGGIGAFGLGHIAYIAAFLRLLSYGQPQPALNAWVFIGCWVFALGVWYRVIYRPALQRTTLHFAALPYALLLSTTVGAALNLMVYGWGLYNMLGSTGNSPVLSNLVRTGLPALGTLLFFISDFILAARLFNKIYFRMVDDWVWLTYGPGQMLIVYGVGIFLYAGGLGH